MQKFTDKADSSNQNQPKLTKQGSVSGCKLEINPQQTEYTFGDVIIDSCFDSGNMASAEQIAENQYSLYLAPDCCGTGKQTHHCTWFYFRVRNVKRHTTCLFTMRNMNYQQKLFNEGLVPVYREGKTGTWKKIDARTLILHKTDKGLEVSWKHNFSNHEDQDVYFAFTYPWSYEEDQALLDQYEQEYTNDKDIYFTRELLTKSRENRRIELLTITSHSKKLETRENSYAHLFPGSSAESRPFMFDKKYVFITSRVHPGETPGSHVFNGLLRFLLDRDNVQAQAFRDNFVMVMIPMLNPDGVYRGHYRCDTNGLNLNRYYINPSMTEHPSIYATRQIVLDLNMNKRLYLYCDLHAHATKRGCFVYGNNFDLKQQVETQLFPKLLSLNSEYFEFDCCSFDEKNVQIRDKGDGKNKEGAGRVALYKATNLVKCYTLECNYASGKFKNVLTTPIKPESNRAQIGNCNMDAPTLENLNNEKIAMKDKEGYNLENFEEIGEGIIPSILDMVEMNPLSRVYSSVYKNVQNVKLNMALRLFRDPPFRFDVYLRKLNKTTTKGMGMILKYLETDIKPDLREPRKGRENIPARGTSKSVIPGTRKRTLIEVNENVNNVIPVPVPIKEVKVSNINFLPPIRSNTEIEVNNDKKAKRSKNAVIIKRKISTTNVSSRVNTNIVKKSIKVVC